MTEQNADSVCTNVVGPVWKLDGESWACALPAGHDGWHDALDGTQWAPDVGRTHIDGPERK